MYDFMFDYPTKVYFGKDIVKKNLSSILSEVKETVMLAYGGGSIKRNGIYDDVMKAIHDAGKQVVEFSGIMSNPTYEKVLEWAAIARENNVDLILAVGGGSVIDCCKIIAAQAVMEEDIWDLELKQGKLPAVTPIALGAIVTASGTGAEMNGTLTIICFLLHHFLNKNWYRNLVKKYTLTKLVMNILNILLLVDILVLLVSGIMMSHTVFTFIPALGSIATARQLHMIASYWCFVLVSCHIGLHWNMVLVPLKKRWKLSSSIISKIIYTIIPIIIALYGVYSFIESQIYLYMFSISDFVFFNYDKTIFLYILENVGIMALFIYLTHQLMKAIRKI